MKVLAAAFALCLLPVTLPAQTSAHFTNPKQVTQGGSNGESYWAPDSKRVIFQSTRGDAKCDQEYMMNADGSDQHLVSTGKGATTCGYFLSDNKHFLYAARSQ
jgi:TolB protein